MKTVVGLIILCVGVAGRITLKNITEEGAPFGCAFLAVLFGLLIALYNYLG